MLLQVACSSCRDQRLQCRRLLQLLLQQGTACTSTSSTIRRRLPLPLHQQLMLLRLELPGVFVELPVPPYVVEEWRALPSQPVP